MTLTLRLTPELEKRLREGADRQGLSADAYALQVLDHHLPRADRREALIALLQSWIDAPDDNEREADPDELLRALDEDRMSDRKLFPPDLKGVTW